MTSERLNVIGLISGGKDSFFNLLHCIELGHRIIALANLFPPADEGTLPIETQWIDPEAPLQQLRGSEPQDGPEETDLNSFMYQTVGHEVIPLYAAATGLPLFRRQIHGSAVRHERDYDYADVIGHNAEDVEETESLLPLLQSIMERHPEANAVCAGAILSTYQRTRVESVALRLGLTPLAYLWKYPILPSPVALNDDAQLLRDMAGVDLDARIIKVASAGLDEGHLWLRASSFDGAGKVKRALKKFGAAQGAVLGEGGEFETLVVDGPGSLFRRRIRVPDEGRAIVHEGGGTSWVKIRGAHLEKKDPDKESAGVQLRQPDLFDDRFGHILEGLCKADSWDAPRPDANSTDYAVPPFEISFDQKEHLITRTFQPETGNTPLSIQAQTSSLVDQAHQFLQSQNLATSQVSNTLILLRDMNDFPAVNAEYSKLFTRANPPSRVTISCGDLLTKGADILLSLTVPRSSLGRQGLHVQSRSYWAPANIGPYSQGIATPLSTSEERSSLRFVAIAGQIPLVPATMVLPAPSATSSQTQVALSLQHLWRIGVDMKVKWWTSAVAFFSLASSESAMQQRAKMAGYAWTEANRPPAEDEENHEELDPWDLKHNSEYQTLGNPDDQDSRPLPDWSLLPLRQQNDWESRLPPVFAVEVNSLPKQAEIEWHAHMGVAGALEGAVQAFSFKGLVGGCCDAWHMLVREGHTMALHTTVSLKAPDHASGKTLLQHLKTGYQESLDALKLRAVGDLPHPYLVYMVSDAHKFSEVTDHGTFIPNLALVPCYSLWAANGTKCRALAMYRRVFTTL